MDSNGTRLGSAELNACKGETSMRSDTFLLTELLRGTVLTGKGGVKHTA